MTINDILKEFTGRFKSPFLARFLTIFLIYNWDMVYAAITQPDQINGTYTFLYIKDELTHFILNGKFIHSTLWRWFAPLSITILSYWWFFPGINRWANQMIQSNKRKLEEDEMESRKGFGYIQFEEYEEMKNRRDKLYEDYKEFKEKKEKMYQQNAELTNQNTKLNENLISASNNFTTLNNQFYDYYQRFDNRGAKANIPRDGFYVIFGADTRWLNYYNRGDSLVGCEVINISSGSQSFNVISSPNKKIEVINFDYDKDRNEVTFTKKFKDTGKLVYLRTKLKWQDNYTLTGFEYEVDSNNTRISTTPNTAINLIRIDSLAKYNYELKYPIELLDN